jgi:hypothetical protein
MTFRSWISRLDRLVGKRRQRLARILIEELDTAVDPNSEQLWLEETRRRYDAFLTGELEARSGDEVMQRARDHTR